MRKTLPTALGLLFVGGLMVAEARAQHKDMSGGMKVTNDEGLIHKAFSKAFGRNATPDELDRWKPSDLTRDELVAWLIKFLARDANVKERRQTIERSYLKSFGREPTHQESGYWLAAVKDKGYGFEGLVGAHNGWLTTADAAPERKAMVIRNHLEAFGRPPTDGELNEWTDSIAKGWGNYSDLLIWNVSQMIGPSKPSLLNELRDMVKRAFVSANLPEPGEAEITAQMGVVKLHNFTFKQFVAFLKK